MAGNSPTGSGALGTYVVPDKDVHCVCTVCMLVHCYIICMSVHVHTFRIMCMLVFYTHTYV